MFSLNTSIVYIISDVIMHDYSSPILLLVSRAHIEARGLFYQSSRFIFDLRIDNGGLALISLRLTFLLIASLLHVPS